MATAHPQILRRPADAWILAALFATLALVVVGFAVLASYQSRPGATGEVPTIWPEHSAIPRTVDRPTLVLFAHPGCACTAATLSELRRLVSQIGGTVAVHVRFTVPDPAGPDWLDTPSWRSARSIAGIDVAADPDGVEAARFGALTSGVVVLYDAAGHLRFTGGITPSRGHMGDSPGRTAILAAVGHPSARLPIAPVFGCALDEPDPVIPP